MAEGIPPFAAYYPGADTHLNPSRRQGVPFAVIHRTQGHDSRGLGRTRHHSSPGTFQFLIREGTLYCYYPAHVRCTHAAGANDGPGIEIEGYTGQAVPERDLAVLGRLARWLHETYGVPLTMYDGPRRWIDDHGFRGFVTHRSVETAPKWRHTNYITPLEWARALSLGGAQEDDVTPEEHKAVMFTNAIVGDIYNVKEGSPLDKRLDAIEAKIAGGGVDPDVLAAKVADLLAARLKD